MRSIAPPHSSATISRERRDHSSPPHLRILIEMTATMMAIKMMMTIRRMGRSAPFFFESFRERGELLGRVEIDRRTRHLYSNQAISIALQECTGPLVAPELRKLREVGMREDCRHADVSIVHAGRDRAFASFPCVNESPQVLCRNTHLIALENEDGGTPRRQRCESRSNRRGESELPFAIDDPGGRRSTEQVRHVLCMSAQHDGHLMSRDLRCARDHSVQRRSTPELHELLGLAQPSRCSGREDEDVG